MRGRWTVLLAAFAPAAASGQEVAYEGGLGVATGDYIFTARTTSWTLSTGLSLRTGRLTLRATAPVFLQNTTLLTGSGAGMIPSGGPSSGMVRDSAMGGGGGGGGMMGGGGGRHLTMPASAVTGYRLMPGDPAVQLAWQALDGSTSLTAAAAAKLPLTDTTAFGTGEWDVGASLSFTRHFAGAAFVGLDVAYWRLGDLPELDFRDPLFGTLSAGRAFGTRWAASAFAAAGTAALRGYDAPASAGLTVARLGTPGLWGITATFGLTQTVPDVALGLHWRVRLR